ncbi:hypothetical protein V475_19155 [Sphingobium baderi LL03]|uniref:Uncharacterized protein n=1 Tax=Sphingobium baderi LL03 TaxID=1114964 RepID=T0GPT0_9SPHN|nr:hypothetical protein L485_01675 [Sphingobium baderi LL03]KMS60535.1 hypothetical protein V475_19155 [Sphingobium baderi LL03]
MGDRMRCLAITTHAVALDGMDVFGSAGGGEAGALAVDSVHRGQCFPQNLSIRRSALRCPTAAIDGTMRKNAALS